MPTEDAWGFDNDIAYVGGCDFLSLEELSTHLTNWNIVTDIGIDWRDA